MLNQILAKREQDMGIKTGSDYVKFYLGLDMGNDINLTSFVNNEKRVLKAKLENKNLNKVRIQEGITVLDQLLEEISKSGEQEVLTKYGK